MRSFLGLTALLLSLHGCGELAVPPGDASLDVARPDVADDAASKADADAAADVVVTSDVPKPPPRMEAVPVAAGVASWSLPRAGISAERRTAFLLPWPSDLARTAQNKADLSFVPGAGGTTIVGQYIREFDNRLDGFSPVGAVYFRFGAPVDPASLPADADASRRDASSVQLIDVDPMSPDRGHRVPLQWYFRPTPTRWWHDNTLAVAPASGFPLRPRTRYALVITRGLRPMGADAYTRDADLDAVLGSAATSDAVVTAARTLYAPVLETLAGVGIARDRILSIAAYTTLDPGAEFFRAAERVQRDVPMPTLVDSTPAMYGGAYFRMTGHYGPNPVFQAGAPPYGEPGSGRFVLDSSGVPMVQRMENIRFALTIPGGPMPPQGWPIAIYAHGTGGDYQTFIQDMSAAAAADQGVAMLGFDQVFHGERAPMGTSPETAFFNFLNAEAGRTNNLQAALDLVQCGRFVRTFTLTITHTDGTTQMVRFNPERVMFFGHSQGGLNGPLWLAAEDGARAAVLSGAAGAFNVSLLLKTRPVNVPRIISSILALESMELVPLHPAITLLQMLVDPSDPVNYGRYIVREPRAGVHAKHVFQTQGFVDTYAADEGIAALARSIGLPLVAPPLHPDTLFPLTGVGSATLPLRSNVVLAGGAAVTGAWMQFDAPTGRDGHFVVFQVPGARLRAASFLGSAGVDPMGVPTVSDMP